MRKIIAFTIVSVDGCFAGPNGEIDWFKNQDEDDRKFAAENADPAATLIFGRTTYEMMAGYWPTAEAIRNDPVVAATMNSAQKIVFSKTLKPEDSPVWKNISILRAINREEIIALKEQAGGDMAILGSGSIVRQLANLGLIDEYQLLVTPIVLGAGKYLFRDSNRADLKLLEVRKFKNGKVFLRYGPT